MNSFLWGVGTAAFLLVWLAITLLAVRIASRKSFPPVRVHRRFRHAYLGDWYANVTVGGKEHTVKGLGTVWHYHPSGRRCSTHVELRMVEEMNRIEMEEESVSMDEPLETENERSRE